MKYSLAIFDRDGTILNTLDDMTDSLNVILKKYNLPLHTVEEVRFMVGNGIPKLIERAVSNGCDNPDFDNILKDFIAYYEKHCAEKTAPYAGIPECIKKLRAAGIKTAVNTNKVEPAAIALCDDYFPGLFDIISGSRPGMYEVQPAAQKNDDDEFTVGSGKSPFSIPSSTDEIPEA